MKIKTHNYYHKTQTLSTATKGMPTAYSKVASTDKKQLGNLKIATHKLYSLALLEI